MRREIVIPIMIMLVSGGIIGLNGSVTARAGEMAGPVRAGMLGSIVAGLVSGVIFAVLFGRHILSDVPTLKAVLPLVIVMGVGSLIVMISMAYALPRVGIVAGLSGIIVGQLVVSVLFDTFGWGGVDVIPLSMGRIAGLALLGVGVYLLLPRQ